MIELAVDYSFARPSPAAIKAQGYKAVGRYLGGAPSKDITRSEAAQLHAAHLAIFLVFEGTPDRAGGGTSAGRADAHAAGVAADLIGYPSSCPIFFAVDFNGRTDLVRPYFEGVHSVLGTRTGVYGSIAITEGLRSLAPYRWQTCAWSGTKVDPEAHIYQRLRPIAGHPIADTDEDVILLPFPMWGPTPAPHPAPGAVTWAQWPSSTVLRPSAAGAAVRVLQTALRDSGLPGVRGITVDGSFGRQTETATRNFQAHRHLSIDGVAGPATRAALIALGDVH